MWDWISKLAELRSAGEAAVVVTVLSVSGSTPRDAGAKMVVLGDAFFGSIGGGRLEHLALADARKLLAEGPSTQTFRYPLGAAAGQCCGGSVELLMEVVQETERLYIYGAGHVGQALCRVLNGTAFQVHLIDERQEWIEHSDLPADVIRHRLDWETFNDEARWDTAHTYVAVMTHEHAMDEEVLADVLKRETRYVGLIGSRNKWNRFAERLQGRGTPAEGIKRVHCPIGLDLGKTKVPQAVAISIAAELLKVAGES